MHRAVRVKASQQMPNYRKPASFLIKETYPLPPYSTVIGMIHTLCGWTSYHPMKVSVQGSYAAVISDYATNYAFGGVKFEPGRHAFGVPSPTAKDPERKEGISKGPKSYELLTDVELLLHILPENPEELAEIEAALLNPPVYPSLGRCEDLLQIREVQIVELELKQGTIHLTEDAYVPCSLIHERGSHGLTGTIYRLGKVFEYAGKNRIRRWKESVPARHMCKGTTMRILRNAEMYLDSLGNLVFPA